MKKSFKYRIKSSKSITQKFQNILNLCRNLYNLALEERINSYKRSKRSISLYDQDKQLPALKNINPEYKKVYGQVLQNVLKRLDKAYQNFFRRIKNGTGKPGFPRFKSHNRYDSFTYPQSGWKLNGNKLILSKIGTFKIILHRFIQGTIKTVTIKKSPSNKWYIIFSCDNVPNKILPKTNQSIGIDVGCIAFITDHKGNKISNPKFFKQSQDILKKRQQILARKKKGSNRRKKARILVAKIYEKIFNQRKDFHFKTAKKFITLYDNIFIEKMKAWNSFRSLNRSMRDVAWFHFFNILSFKAEEAGRTIIEVPCKDTSQMCSSCHKLVPKDLSVRIHNCPHCNLSIDRDHNAALNIYRLGASLLQNLS